MGLALATAQVPAYSPMGLQRLRAQHGRRWVELVEWVSALPISDPHMMAFTRTVRQIRKLLNMDSDTTIDPFCQHCASHVIAQYHGSEEELLRLYHRNLNEITETLHTMRRRSVELNRFGIA
jgi:hypothetical protein